MAKYRTPNLRDASSTLAASTSLAFTLFDGALSRAVPVRRFAAWTKLRLALTFRGPLMLAPFAFPVINSLFYSGHARMLSRIIYYVK